MPEGVGMPKCVQMACLSQMKLEGQFTLWGAAVQGAQACNGWTFWHVDRKGNPVSIDLFRQMVRAELAA
jgi:modification methylase